MRVVILLFMKMCCFLNAQSQFELPKKDFTAMSPEAVFKGFIQDHQTWNNFAVQWDRSHKNDWATIDKSYKHLLQQYCVIEGRTWQGAAFGDLPSFQGNIEMKHSKLKKDQAMLLVGFTKPGATYTDVYEVLFVQANNRWYIEEINLIDEEEKYPFFDFKPA
jgi:hypothetical protein